MKFLATPLTTLVLALGVIGATISVRAPAAGEFEYIAPFLNILKLNTCRPYRQAGVRKRQVPDGTGGDDADNQHRQRLVDQPDDVRVPGLVPP